MLSGKLEFRLFALLVQYEATPNAVLPAATSTIFTNRIRALPIIMKKMSRSVAFMKKPATLLQTETEVR